MALHKHEVSDVIKSLSTFASLALSTLAAMFFHLHALTATIMLRMFRPVLPRNFTALGKNIKFDKMSHENLSILLGNKKIQYYFDLRAPYYDGPLCTPMKLYCVLENENFQTLHETAYFGRGPTMSYGKASTKTE